MSPATMQSSFLSNSNATRWGQLTHNARRFARRQSGLRRSVAGENSPHPRHVQLAEAVHLRLLLDFDPGRANLLEKVRIAFFNDDASLDAGGKAANLLQRQRIRQAEFQHAGVAGPPRGRA